MSEVAAIIADLVRAGVDPDLIGRTASALAEREPIKIFDEQAERKRAADRERLRIKRENEKCRAMSRDVADTPLDKEGFPHTPSEEINPPKEKTPKGVQKKGPRTVLESVLSKAHASAVVDHRQRIRKPLTEHAAELLAKKLADAPTTCGMTPEQAADFMILRGWQSFDPEWAKNAAPVSQPIPGPVDDDRWVRRLKYARSKKCWSSTDWGPAPGQGGCLVPSHLLEPSDGQDWSEYQNAA